MNAPGKKAPMFTESQRDALLARIPAVREAVLTNMRPFAQFNGARIPIAGPSYPGLWLEHCQDWFFMADPSLGLGEEAERAAWTAMEAFPAHQRDDGMLPFCFPLRWGPAPEFFDASAEFWQIQAVWSPIRAGIELARRLNRPESDFARLYDCGARYDAWFRRYRNRAETGLVEMYCEYDTGHDNDPRVIDGGIPHSCPGNDASNMPALPCMPVLSVDLSAMLFGTRIALAELADLLGRPADAVRWRTEADAIGAAIRRHLYDPEDEFFYDRDPSGFRRYRTEHVTRLFLNGVLTQDEFDRTWKRHFAVPGRGFAPPYPIPAVAVDDPHFPPEPTPNCWGRNSQAPTLLRALLWADRYGRGEWLDGVLAIWLGMTLQYADRYCFQQEIDPLTGVPIGDTPNFMPALLLYLAACRRILL
jgi:hypothetical protein